MKRGLQIDKELLPEGFEEREHSGVFLVLLSAGSEEELQRKVKAVKTMAEIIKAQ